MLHRPVYLTKYHKIHITTLTGHARCSCCCLLTPKKKIKKVKQDKSFPYSQQLQIKVQLFSHPSLIFYTCFYFLFKHFSYLAWIHLPWIYFHHASYDSTYLSIHRVFDGNTEGNMSRMLSVSVEAVQDPERYCLTFILYTRPFPNPELHQIVGYTTFKSYKKNWIEKSSCE